ncbi:low-specificity L-threonine aldolase 1-like isoform X2 [Cucumis melo]|uniref:Low-specificity L-threonine aldolase 1-like isoform X2 n=1 Tax=Cucumis melo TaxID=3656 RepID=A0A1S3BWA2_CUCME|nr:low-specificity L-threonine aldolase 1-like isoform X2 [Cucumis melo]
MFMQINPIVGSSVSKCLKYLKKLYQLLFLGLITSSISRFQCKMVSRKVDLRSDTVTKPTESMRAAMAMAEVDDDVLGYDPTALELEEKMAKIMGKEGGLFVPSGTMGNLISILVHCETRGSEVIVGDNSHIHILENGGIATIGGVHPRTVKNKDDGTMDIDLIEAAIRNPKGQLFFPTTRLICLENTHANSGGKCLSMEYTDEVGELAKKHDLKLHIDGARIFNASIALAIPVDRLVCLSKGLGAPVGSIILGSKDFITKAIRIRKTLGGGMRQIGILCAAGLVAIKENVQKLEADHEKAKQLASGLYQIKGLKVDPKSVETNIIFFEIEDDYGISMETLCKTLEERGIFMMLESQTRARIVLHHQISTSDVQYTLSCFKQTLNGIKVVNGN